MIDHVTFGVTDLDRSLAFYDRALRPLGISRLFSDSTSGVHFAGYGDTRPWFWLVEADPTRGMLHIAFSAASRAEVDAFHSAAVLAGGRDNGAPGLRRHYHSSYYGAFVLDPDGHNIEAVCHRP